VENLARDLARPGTDHDHPPAVHPRVQHEDDAIAFDADVSRRAQGARDRVLRSL
jgi:hypothetical protein